MKAKKIGTPEERKAQFDAMPSEPFGRRDSPSMSDNTEALRALDLVEALAAEAGFKADSSLRHNLAIGRAALAQQAATPAPAEPVPIDYDSLIRHCYKLLGHAQGTKGCVAFAKGAEWYRDQLAAPPATPAAQPAAKAEPPVNERLLRACRKAAEWLEGWATAEPYLSELERAIADGERALANAPATELPPLPPAILYGRCAGLFTADQMRDYARAALKGQPE